jgi:hypothetical protein
MPKITFKLEPPVMEVSPGDYLEACSPREVDKLIDLLAEEHQDALESCIKLSPETFLDKCHSGELEFTHKLLHDAYGIGEDDDARSEGQRLFNHHLTCLREAWLSVSKEDAEIVAILGKKYGAL